jgi:protein TonB
LGFNPSELPSPQSHSEADQLEKDVAKVQAESGANDYVKGIPLGDMTKLNSVEFKHFGFYNRIKGQLEQYWGASLKEKAKKIYKSGRSVAGQQDFITNLEVAINLKGKITQIKLKTTSGMKELDDAAVESFNKAGPFPNPPQELVINGEAWIKWGFVVKS